MEEMKVIAAVIGAAVALLGLFKAVAEYQLQGTQRRADFFLRKRAEYYDNESLSTIRALLEDDSPKLREVPREERRAYLTFFEEIALLWRSGLIRDDIACYMFGYYAVKCRMSKNFWFDIAEPKRYWSVFLAFESEMLNRLQSEGQLNPKKMKF